MDLAFQTQELGNPVAVSNKVESESSEMRFQAVVIVKLFIADKIQFYLNIHN